MVNEFLITGKLENLLEEPADMCLGVKLIMSLR